MDTCKPPVATALSSRQIVSRSSARDNLRLSRWTVAGSRRRISSVMVASMLASSASAHIRWRERRFLDWWAATRHRFFWVKRHPGAIIDPALSRRGSAFRVPHASSDDGECGGMLARATHFATGRRVVRERIADQRSSFHFSYYYPATDTLAWLAHLTSSLLRELTTHYRGEVLASGDECSAEQRHRFGLSPTGPCSSKRAAPFARRGWSARQDRISPARWLARGSPEVEGRRKICPHWLATTTPASASDRSGHYPSVLGTVPTGTAASIARLDFAEIQRARCNGSIVTRFPALAFVTNAQPLAYPEVTGYCSNPPQAGRAQTRLAQNYAPLVALDQNADRKIRGVAAGHALHVRYHGQILKGLLH